MNTQNLVVGLLALLIGLLLGSAMFPVSEEVVVVEQVLVPGEDVLIEVPVIDDRYDYYVES